MNKSNKSNKFDFSEGSHCSQELLGMEKWSCEVGKGFELGECKYAFSQTSV
jgi:hypothetical protein